MLPLAKESLVTITWLQGALVGLVGNMAGLALSEEGLSRVVFGSLLNEDLTSTTVFIATDLLDDKFVLLGQQSLGSNLSLGSTALQLGVQVASGLVGDQLLEGSGKSALGLLGGGSSLSWSRGLCWGSGGLSFRGSLQGNMSVIWALVAGTSGPGAAGSRVFTELLPLRFGRNKTEASRERKEKEPKLANRQRQRREVHAVQCGAQREREREQRVRRKVATRPQMTDCGARNQGCERRHNHYCCLLCLLTRQLHCQGTNFSLQMSSFI